MFRLIRWLFSTIFTIIVIGLVLYFFKFSIRGDALCISLRHSEHKRVIKQIEHKVKKDVEESKKHLTEHVKDALIKGNEKKDEGKKNGSDEERLKEIIKDHIR